MLGIWGELGPTSTFKDTEREIIKHKRASDAPTGSHGRTDLFCIPRHPRIQKPNNAVLLSKSMDYIDEYLNIIERDAVSRRENLGHYEALSGV